MNNEAHKHDVTLDTLTYFITAWNGQANRVGARQDLIAARNRLRLEAQTGRIPQLQMRKKTWFDYFKQTKPTEWAMAVIIFVTPFWIPEFLRALIEVGQYVQTLSNH